jgi:outer membrane protein assembly factor BamB
MKTASYWAFSLVACLTISIANWAAAQNWPQWRGPNRDAKATGFTPPATWPKELTQKWKVTVGNGPSSPALVDGKLYVIGRQGSDEVVRCLDAATGDEVWSDKYSAQPPMGPAAEFSGPRSSPTVGEGKVVTLGVHGTLTCYDASKGNIIWRKEGYGDGALPRFDPASSPIIMNGHCIAQVGGEQKGGILAYDLASGDERWSWTGDGPAYSSPVVLTIDGDKAIVAVTANKLVAISAADGKTLWQTSYSQGRYNAATPIIAGQTVIYAGPSSGMTAVSMEKEGDALKASPRWKNPDNSLMYNTPVLRDGWLYGISNLNSLFCVNAESGESAWSAPMGQPAGGTGPTASGEKKSDQPATEKKSETAAADQKSDEKKGEPGGPGPGMKGMKGGKGMGMRGGMRGGMGGGGYGSVVDAGKVLVAMIPSGQLVVFEPNEKEFKQIASYKVAEGDAYAYPILSGNKIFVRDKDSLVAWTIE